MTNYDDISGGLYGLSYGFNDIVSIIRNHPREFYTSALASAITTNNIVPVSSYSFDNQQDATVSSRFAGEGAGTHVFGIKNIKLHSTLQFPLISPIEGWVQPIFAEIWDLAKYAFWGCGSSITAKIAVSASSGASNIYVTNIADFKELTLPFNLNILNTDGTTAETVSVSAVDKATRKLTVSALSAGYSVNTVVVALPLNSGGALHDPSFSLLSLREGLFAPSLVNKITINAKTNSNIDVTVDLSSLRCNRTIQSSIKGVQASLMTSYKTYSPGIVLSGSNIKIMDESSTIGYFGQATATDDPLFSGFQGLLFPNVSVKEISIEINNELEEVYAAHSSAQGSKKRRENAYPFLLVSKGRRISGKITYLGSAEAWAITERLAGPSSLVGRGLAIDFGTFKIRMPEVIWKPYSSSGAVEDNIERTIEWTMLSEDSDSMPDLEYSTRI